MHRLTPFWKGVVGAICGTVVVLMLAGLSWHAYQDHTTFHNLLDAIERNNRQQAAPKP